MFAFIFKLIIASVLIYCALTLRKNSKKQPPVSPGSAKSRGGDSAAEELNQTILGFLPIGAFVSGITATVIVVWALLGTSAVWIPSGDIGVLKRIYFGKALPAGHIVALNGELGPQARILTAGFHFELFLTLTHEIENKPVFTVPDGQCALLSAKYGQPISGGSAFAEPWTDDIKQKMINDAEFFLTEGKGQRGPQTTVLTPGSYTINPFLWEDPRIIPATRVEQGTVGVVKSSVRSHVDFGAFKRELSKDNTLKVLTPEKLPEGSATALLVPVGAIGVWEEPLPNGLYYINTEAYRITMVPATAQVYEYKGGYTRRTVDISVNDKGQITERVREDEVQAVHEGSADRAVFTRPEGWDVPQELRVLAQVSPELAPFVVASLGLTQENSSKVIQERVITPIIRSVVRNVLGGAQVNIKQSKPVVDKDGKNVLDAKGQPKIEVVNELRPVKVLDLLENRSSLEDAIDQQARPQALKEGVTILEIRLSESAIPAELLIARKREQLAQQLTAAWKQEELAQDQRQHTENSRAQAEQQGELVKADISAQAAQKRATARTTEGKGEEAYLIAIAEGQKAQSNVLGQEQTARLQMFQQTLKFFSETMEKNPDMVVKVFENLHKLSPEVLVLGGDGGGLEGPSAIVGQLIGRKNNSGNGNSSPVPATAPVKQ
ncbi:MAG: hypothetical protein WCI52_02575 [bacterium]